MSHEDINANVCFASADIFVLDISYISFRTNIFSPIIFFAARIKIRATCLHFVGAQLPRSRFFATLFINYKFNLGFLLGMRIWLEYLKYEEQFGICLVRITMMKITMTQLGWPRLFVYRYIENCNGQDYDNWEGVQATKFLINLIFFISITA